MKTGKDYPLFCFNEPEWLPAYNCYTRSISIMHYPGYKPYDNILELLDKNFNHIAYVTGNDIYCTPALTYDGLNTFDKNARRPHRVHLKKKIAKVNAEKCLSTFLVKNKQIVPIILLLLKISIFIPPCTRFNLTKVIPIPFVRFKGFL